MNAPESIPCVARVTLGGYPPREARLAVAPFPRRRRAAAAAKTSLRAWALMPVRFVATLGADIVFLPLNFAVGAIWGFQVWKQRYEVREVEACCPRCDSPLPVKPGDTVQRPHVFDCVECHFRPELHFEEPAPEPRRLRGAAPGGTGGSRAPRR